MRQLLLCLTACLALAFAGCETAPPSAPAPQPNAQPVAPAKAAPPATAEAVPPATPASAPAPPAGAPATARKAPASTPAVAPVFEPLDMTKPVERTPDGLAVMTVRAKHATTAPSLRWLDPARSTMHWPEIEASDGARVYAAIDGKSGERRDIVIRDGRVYLDVLNALGATGSTGIGPKGGCVAARAGQLAIAFPGQSRDDFPSRSMPGQAAYIGVDGSLTRSPLAGIDRRVCSKSWMDPDGTFVVDRNLTPQTPAGETRSSLGRAVVHTVGMQSTKGPLMCVASYCSKDLKKAPSTAMMKALASQPGCSKRKVRIHGRWAAGVCIVKDTVHVARLDLDTHKQASGTALGRAIERTSVASDAPTPLVAITDDGDVVVGLDYRFGKYAVWRAGASRPSPVRELASDEVLAGSNPPLLIRGLGATAPKSDTGATLMGRKLAYGAGGSTTMWPTARSGAQATAAALDRARAVLPAEPNLRYAGEGAVDLNCGSYVRSPPGSEGVHVSDGAAVERPPLFKEAVYHPKDCLPLKSVTALPGYSSVLLAITAKDELAITMLPKPLPLPPRQRRGPLVRRGPPPVTPTVTPRPGPGWTVLSDIKVVSIDGFGGELDASGGHNGKRTYPGQASWQHGGAAIVTVADPARAKDALLIGHQGSAWLPRSLTPMAALQYELGFFGADADTLIACGKDHQCRRFPLGVGSPIDAVVPRTTTSLVIGFKDGREAVFDLPATGGQTLPTNAVPATIDAAIVALSKQVHRP